MAASQDKGALEIATVELTRLVAPIGNAAEAASEGRIEPLVVLLDDMGIDQETLGGEYEAIVETAKDIAEPWGTIREDLIVPVSSGEIPDADKIRDVIEAFGDLFDALGALDDLNAPGLPDGSEVGKIVVDYLIAEYLDRYQTPYYGIFSLSDVIVNENSPEPTRVDLSRFPDLLQNPETIPQDVLGWGTNGFKAFFVIYNVHLILSNFAPSNLESADVFKVPQGKEDDRNLTSQIDVPFLSENLGGGVSVLLGSKLVPVPPHGDKKTGLGLVPYAEGELNQTFDLGGGWEFNTQIGADLQDWALVAQPSNSGTNVGLRVLERPLPTAPADMKTPLDDSGNPRVEGLPNLHAEAGIAYTGEEGEPKLLLGTRDGSGLYLDHAGARTIVDAEDDDVNFTMELPTSLSLDVQPKGGFLKKILPPKGVNGGFGASMGWSKTRGIYFDGSAKLSTTIPINESVGKKGAKIELVEVYLAVEVGGDEADVRLTGAVTANAQLGPISGTVRQMGVHGDVTFPEDRDGNLGPVDFSPAFKPPTGVGLSIDSPGVSGGGFLGYDPDNERYSAIFSLTIGPVQVQVFGLLATEMPDGSDGFSLLISVSATFPPVQLSFGFTLNGLGGVIGINRALMTKPLRKAARTGSLNNVLFPDNPAGNPAQLISDLRTIYPVTRAQHVFGPMARLGWGTPNQIQLDVGIVLQLPTFKIAILGVFRVGLPSLDVPKVAQVLRLNLSVAGTVNPQKKLVAVAASLYDSRIVQWSVKGGMAMRLRWGDAPEFLLSIGGFHPQFKPPESFPTIDPVVVSLAIPGGNPSVQWTGYFAVTSNTVQVGAGFKAKFTVGPVKAKGWWSIDALFQFKPFKFIVGLSAGLEVKVKKFTLSVTLEGSLKGPSPTHIRGKLSIQLPGPLPDPSPNVHFTLGEEKPSDDALPSANVLEELSTAVEKPGNWAAQLPEGGEELVSVREVEAGEKEVLAHPMGRLSVRQTIVPLGKTVDKYGENRPVHKEFTIEIGTGDDESLPTLEDTKESFAPEKYEEMSDSEKLNAPSFVDMTAGRQAAGDQLHWGCEVTDSSGNEQESPSNAASAELIYEPSREEPFPDENLADELPQSDGGETEERRPAYPPDVTRSLSDDGSVANADRRFKGNGKFRPDGPEYDPVEHKSNGAVIDGPVLVTRDPVIFDTVEYATATGGGSS